MLQGLAFAIALSLGSAAAAADLPPKPRIIPTADFATDRPVSGPVLSPNGQRMLARIYVSGVEKLGIHSFTGEPIRLIGLPPKTDLRWYRWAGNGRVLISLGTMNVSELGENYLTRLMLYDLDTKVATPVGKRSAGFEGDDVLWIAPDGSSLLLAVQKSIYDYPSVFRVGLPSNAMTEVVKQRPDVWEWYADNDGVVRFGVGFGDTKWSMVYRAREGEPFRKAGRARYDDEEASLDILRVASGSDEGYVLSNKETGRFGLYRYNYATKQIGEKVFDDSTYDVTDFDLTPDGSTVRAVWYTSDRDRILWFDPVMKKVQADLDAAVKDRENWVVSRARDDSAMIVWVGGSNDPGRYYVYRPAVGRMNIVARTNPTLKTTELAPSRYVSYKARDGLAINAYLTLPLGRDPKKLPLVIMPHGGPYFVRDRGSYDPQVQMLVNRGYAVLQPNFRGSEGYGRDFYRKGEGQWGRQMQDDLDDGMDWVVAQGIADPKRVCIVGGSYGGYAALWGATRNPERYRCAASFAGVTDVKRQLGYQLNFAVNSRYRKDWRKTVQGGDQVDLKTVSPLYNVAKLQVPVLLAHGDDDSTVPFRQSKSYADALKAAGRSYEFYPMAGEGHGFSKSENLKLWLDKLDAFMARHNPAE